MSRNEIVMMLEFFRANLVRAKDPLEKAAYKKSIAKYERKLEKAGA